MNAVKRIALPVLLALTFFVPAAARADSAKKNPLSAVPVSGTSADGMETEASNPDESTAVRVDLGHAVEVVLRAQVRGERAVLRAQVDPDDAPPVARPRRPMMPVMDGWQLIGALSRDDRFATLPVIVVSASNDRSPEGYRQVKKPIDLDDLVKIVGELCQRRR